MSKANNKSEAENLRKRAEDLMKKKSVKEMGILSEVETLKAIHEQIGRAHV